MSDVVDTPRRKWAIYDWEPSLTKQSFADECNLNSKVLKYGAAALAATHTAGRYEDVSNVGDYMDYFNAHRQTMDFYDGLSDDLKAKYPTAAAFFEKATPEDLRVAFGEAPVQSTPVSEKSGGTATEGSGGGNPSA